MQLAGESTWARRVRSAAAGAGGRQGREAAAPRPHSDQDAFTEREYGRDSADAVRARARAIEIRAAGDLRDLDRLRRLLEQFESAIASRPERMVLDLSRVEFADTKLAAVLVSSVVASREANVQLRFRPSVAVKTALHVYGLGFLLLWVCP